MGRSQVRVERMTKETISAIDKTCYGSRSAYWRRHIDERKCSLAQFSTAMRGELTDPSVIDEIVDSLPAAALQQPMDEVIGLKCSGCGCAFDDKYPIATAFGPDGFEEYRKEDVDFGDKVRLKS